MNRLIIVLLYLPFYFQPCWALNSSCIAFYSDITTQKKASDKALAPTHPAVLMIKNNIKNLIQNKSGSIDPRKFLKIIHTANDNLAGKFQIYPFNGELYIIYFENNRAYIVENSAASGVTFRPHRRFPEASLESRFRVPKGMNVVGYERGYDGKIIPILSTSTKFVEFRDFRNYQSSIFLGDLKSQERLSREALVVKLYPIKTLGKLGKTDSAFKSLPSDLQGLLDSNHTLSTEFSLGGMDPKYLATHMASNFSQYSAFIVGDQTGQGRTGILLKDGMPVLVTVKGNEYFIEVKGIGRASDANTNDNQGRVILDRITQRIRSGRASRNQVIRELKGYRLAKKIDSEAADLSRPIAGVELPELVSVDRIFDQENPSGHETSAQVFRLASSTRRLAYSDNDAFGTFYSRRQHLLELAQRFYGRQLARFSFLSGKDMYSHHSPHAQNFIYIPIKDKFSITDFSDIHREDDSLSVSMPDIDQFLVFDNQESRKIFLEGLKAELEPQGLWTSRLEDLSGKKFTPNNLQDILISEILIQKILDGGNPKEIRNRLLPQFYELQFHFEMILKKDSYALANQPEFLEIAFKQYHSSLKEWEKLLADIETSTSIAVTHREFQEQIRQARKKITDLLKTVNVFLKKEDKKSSAWENDIGFYVRQMKEFLEIEATIYDSITQYRQGTEISNLDQVRKELSRFGY